MDGAFSSRYLITSHLFVAVLLCLLFIKFEGKKWIWYVAGLNVLILLFTYKANYDYGEACMDMTRRRLEGMPYFYGNHSPEANKKAAQLEADACKLGIYCMQDER